MKLRNKALIAAAIMVAAGSASAAITANNTGADQAFLVAFDSAAVNTDGSLGRTYNLNLGITFDQLAAGNYTALTSAVASVATDANWTTFTTGMTSSAKYGIFDGNTSAFGAFLSGGSVPPQAYGSVDAAGTITGDPTVLTGSLAATTINAHAVEINKGLGANASSLILQIPDNSTGQADHTLAGLPFSSVWGGANTGTGYNPLTAVGSTANFFKVGYHLDFTTDYTGFGAETIVGTPVVFQSDISKIGSFTLASTGLTFAPAAVPLPAAVWMFGAGLMGLLRMNRRKTVQA